MSTYHKKIDYKTNHNPPQNKKSDECQYSIWYSNQIYTKGSIVNYNGYSWISINNSEGKLPTKCSDYWFQLCKTDTVIKTGDWKNTECYNVGDIVKYNNFTWICTFSNTNQQPQDLSYYCFVIASTILPNYKTINTLYNRITDYEVLFTDNIIQIQNNQNIYVYLPQANTNAGQEIIVSKLSDNDATITIETSSGDSIDNGTDTMISLSDQYEKVILVSNGINLYYIL